MRDIKFRAWDKENKKMSIGGYFKTLEIDGKTQEWFGMPTPHPDDCELMQYTGLKDKNEKEIYEGDIIEFDKYEWYRSPVRSRDDIDKLPAYREKITFDHEGVSRSKNDLEKYCEVIGNIYENPDLLEGKVNPSKSTE